MIRWTNMVGWLWINSTSNRGAWLRSETDSKTLLTVSTAHVRFHLQLLCVLLDSLEMIKSSISLRTRRLVRNTIEKDIHKNQWIHGPDEALKRNLRASSSGEPKTSSRKLVGSSFLWSTSLWLGASWSLQDQQELNIKIACWTKQSQNSW